MTVILSTLQARAVVIDGHCGVGSQKSMGLMGVDMAFLNPATGQGLPDAPSYDLILTMDAVHDMARPDLVMPLVRKVRRPVLRVYTRSVVLNKTQVRSYRPLFGPSAPTR